MFHALGYSQTEFLVSKAGRLCRGRERWIAPWTEDSSEVIHRLIISGAALNDDAAARALRGVPRSGISVAHVLSALFGEQRMLGFMEDGHPADIPEDAHDVELYEGHRAAGRSEEIFVRWTAEVSGQAAMDRLIGDEPVNPAVRGFLPLNGTENLDTLKEQLFFLTGLSSVDSPPAQFQPEALTELLTQVSAVVLFHRDKHGPALGVYSRERLDVVDSLTAITDAASVLLVPFAIPPMLARWDRALAELRATWPDERGDFPIPVAAEGSRWEDRRRRRSDRKSPEPTVVDDDALLTSADDALLTSADDALLTSADDALLTSDDDTLLLIDDDLLLVVASEPEE